MIFRNTIRLLLTNFSNVWKVLVYYIICVALTIGVCWSIASPIIAKLSEANVFSDLGALLNSLLSQPHVAPTTLHEILATAKNVILSNAQFTPNYIFFIVWLVFVFPFTIDMAGLALGEVFYGYMTSQVKYSFTGRFIKNIGKSSIYSLCKYFVQFLLNVAIFVLFYLMIKLYSYGSFLYILLDIGLLALLLCVIAFKYTMFSCFMPAMAVLDCGAFSALRKNFKIVFKNFFRIFSNCITLVITALVINLIFCVFTFSVSLIITLPLTAVVFVIFQMVSYFSSCGMRFYVYPDMFISPKKFEEQDKVKKVKYII